MSYVCNIMHDQNEIPATTQLLLNAVQNGVSRAGSRAKLEQAAGLPENILRGLLATDHTRIPSVENAKKIAEALGLEFYIGPPRDFDPIPEVEVDGAYFDTVPRYDAQAAGGSGVLNLDEDPIDRLAFNKDWLSKQGIHAGHCALITAQGRSMEPRIYDGDLIMIDRRRTSIRSGRVYVFNDGDRGTRVKQLEHIPDLGVILHSDNREEYPPETRAGSSANDITILGEVVWSGHKWG